MGASPVQEVMSKSASRRAIQGAFVRAFTLLELLVVIAVIAALAALLLPMLEIAKAHSQSTACENRLRQIGMALTMYVSDSHRYPPMWGEETGVFQTWADKLYPYEQLNWTNTAWHCPTYIANKGIVRVVVGNHPGVGVDLITSVKTSYSYNSSGIAQVPGIHPDAFRLGLGWYPASGPVEAEVLVPSQMFAVADARTVREEPDNAVWGDIAMTAYYWTYRELPPTHAGGYNTLFCDGHVLLFQRKDLLYPPRTAHNWNRDNQPHPEVWAPRNRWVVQW